MDAEIESEDGQCDEPTGSPLQSQLSLYIEVIHHPHSGSWSSSIIQIASQASNPPRIATFINNSAVAPVHGKPWAPFRTCADFKFAEFVLGIV